MSVSEHRARNFLENQQRPERIRFWQYKQESALTLSVVIADQGDSRVLNRIVAMQEELGKNVRGLPVVDDPYAHRGTCLYRYPRQELHCSLVRVLSSPHAFLHFVETMKQHFELEQQIVGCVEKQTPPRCYATIGGFYSGGSDAVTDSFSLQMFPDPEFIAALKRIRDCLTPDALGKLPEGLTLNPNVKGYPGADDPIERFPLNILRLMHNAGAGEEVAAQIGDAVQEGIERINTEYKSAKERWLTLKIKKLVLVETDPFLHNPNTVKEFLL